MVKYLCRQLSSKHGTKLQRLATKQKLEKYKREKAKEDKIERLAAKFENVPRDEVEGWVDEDFDRMEFLDDEQGSFLEELSGNINLPIKSTGTTWHGYYKPLGRVFQSIHRMCSENNKTTVLIFRPDDPTVYRLSTEQGKEFEILSKAIREGYILSLIKVHTKGIQE